LSIRSPCCLAVAREPDNGVKLTPLSAGGRWGREWWWSRWNRFRESPLSGCGDVNAKSRAPPRGDEEVSFTSVGRTSVPADNVENFSTFSLAAGRPVDARSHDALKRGTNCPPFRQTVGGARRRSPSCRAVALAPEKGAKFAPFSVDGRLGRE
jgi:hypothetical protein